MIESTATITIGNGRNELLMLAEAVLCIAILQEQSVFTRAIMESDMICRSITDALKRLMDTKRLVTALRMSEAVTDANLIYLS
mgnify:CR=1 FL=1